MDILPILATLKRHKTAASLIVLQIALTCAIVCNALFLIMQRNDRIQQPSGLAEEEILVLSVNNIGPTEAPEALTRTDLAALRAVPGVRSATLLNQVPFGNNSNSSTIRTLPNEQGEGIQAASYNASEGWLETLGLRLVEGRNFEANEYQDQLALERSDDPIYPAVILNQAMAKRLFPKGKALGQAIYGFGNRPIRIVGIVEQLTPPQPGLNNENKGYSLVLPVRETFRGRPYVLRSDPAQHEAVLKAAALSLDRSGPNRILRESQRLAEMRQDYYQQDRSMVLLLASVCVALLLVTAFGIVGLASFWVQQRTRMIGTRRALGATRGQILRYFQTENFILSTVGIVLGMGAAYGISLALMKQYAMPPLPLAFLPLGALILWALGQLAVLAPARRAAALPPVAALRGA